MYNFIWDTIKSLNFTNNPSAGLTLIDVIVGVAIAVTLLAAVFGMFQTSLKILTDAGARSQATALAEQRMEYVRSLPYRQVGTEGGIPDGVLTEKEEITRNETTYTRRTFVQYYDDPEDGTGDNDSNDVVQDYKRAKVAVSWSDGSQTKTVESATYVVPNGVESSSGGGTLSFKVFDATGDPVNDAKVEIYNPDTSPEIETQTYTNASGTTRFSGAPAASNYQVIVSKPNYSTSKTYDETETNTDPDPGHLTVATSSVTSASFPIDVLSDLAIQTLTPIQSASSSELFTDASGIEQADNIILGDDELILDKTNDGYATSGQAYTTEFGTSTVRRWKQLDFTASTSAETEARLHVAAKTDAGFERLPDSQLSGNETGFTNPPVDLSAVATSTYDYLTVEIGLETTATDTTPALEKLSITYQAGRMDKSAVSLDIRGEKAIGERPDGSSIYKHSFTTSTDQTGQRQLSGLEWDNYHFKPTVMSDQRVAAACPREPYSLSAGTSSSLQLAIANISDKSDHALRVDVNDDGQPIGQATSTLERTGSGFSEARRTYDCGQSFFADLGDYDDYRLTVTADGYPKKKVNNISVPDQKVIRVDLSN